MSLEKRTVSAFRWSGLERLAQGISGTIVQLILARILAPEDFGLIAMLVIFLELGRSLVDSGFSAALIQRREVSRTDLSSVFFFNLIVATGLSLLLTVFAPYVAAFYCQPLLRYMLAVLSLRLILDALGTVHAAILSRRLEIRALAASRVPATVVGGITGVVLALAGFGGWALIGQVLVQAACRSALLWYRSDWRPSLGLKMDSLRKLTPFGSRLLAAALLDKLGRNIYLAIIGKRFAPAALGFYYQARRYQGAPSMAVVRVLNHVLLPVFSSVQNDRPRLLRGAAKGTRILAFAYFPAIVGLIATAEALIEVLVTAKWLPAVPYFRLLCLSSLFSPLYALNHGIIKAKGAAGSVLRIEVVKRVIEFSLLLVTFRWGISWMISGQIIASLLGWALSCRYTHKLIGFGLSRQLRESSPYLVLASGMGVAVYSLRLLDLQPLPVLAVQVVVGASLYLAAAFAAKLPATRESIELLRQLD